MKQRVIPRSFKPWPENDERLEYAQKLGFEVSVIVNELLRENLKPWIDREKQKRLKALTSPTP